MDTRTILLVAAAIAGIYAVKLIQDKDKLFDPNARGGGSGAPPDTGVFQPYVSRVSVYTPPA